MFDLFRSRARIVRILLTVLLSLVALSMVITLIPGFGSAVDQSSDQVVAEVGDMVVTSRMLRQAIQMQMQSRQLSADLLELFVPQIVNQMVSEYATAYQAQRMGFKATDEDVVKTIRTLIPQLFQDGRFAGTDLYRQFLAQNNTTIPEFEANVRRQILLSKLQAVAFEGIVVTPQEVEAEFRSRNQKVRLNYLSFKPDDFRNKVNPTRAQLEEFLQARQAQFQIPAKRTLSLVVVDENKLGENIQISDAQLRQAYDSQRDRFRVEEQVKVRHILMKTTAGDDKHNAEVRKQMEDILKQLRGGANFEELAKKYSEDPGSNFKGGDLGFVSRGQTVANFEKTAFTLAPNTISDIIETEYGYHILQVLEKQPGRLKPLEEVKDELIQELKRRQLYDRMPALAEQARAELVKDPGAAREIARKLNLAYARAENVGPGDPLPLVGVSQDLEFAVTSLEKGGVTQVIQTEGNKLVVAVVEDVTPARPARLAEVEKDVRETYVREKAREMAEKKAKEFEARLRANNNDLEKTARELGYSLNDTGEFDRQGEMKGIGTAAYFADQPFTNPVGAVVGPYRVSQDIYFYKIVSQSPPDPSKLESERDAIVSMIRDRKMRERREIFEETLIEQLRKEGKLKVHDDVIKRIVAAYRG